MYMYMYIYRVNPRQAKSRVAYLPRDWDDRQRAKRRHNLEPFHHAADHLTVGVKGALQLLINRYG